MIFGLFVTSTATRCSLREIKSARDAIKSREDEVLNYFINHSTNIIYTRINMQNQGGSQMPGMKIMMYAMPIMFLVFFNNYAAGLSYYYFISLLITIIQTPESSLESL